MDQEPLDFAAALTLLRKAREDSKRMDWLHRELKVTIADALKWTAIPQDVTSFRAKLDEAIGTATLHAVEATRRSCIPAHAGRSSSSLPGVRAMADHLISTTPRRIPIMPKGTEYEFHSGVVGIDEKLTLWDGQWQCAELAQVAEKDRRAIAEHMIALWQRFGGIVSETAFAVPPGWKMVPIEPSQPMFTAYRSAMKHFIESQATAEQRAKWSWDSRGYVVPEDVKMRARWQAMIAAAPEATHG